MTPFYENETERDKQIISSEVDLDEGHQNHDVAISNRPLPPLPYKINDTINSSESDYEISSASLSEEENGFDVSDQETPDVHKDDESQTPAPNLSSDNGR